MAQTFDVLSHHEVICEFTGIEHIPCRFRTSRCPDHCDHASDAAIFEVIEYKDYKKEGKYGDEKQKKIFCEIRKPVLYQEPEIAEICKKLTPGQKVELVYDHLYITTESGSKYPVRPVRSIKEL